MSQPWGRYTVRGGDEVEAAIGRLVVEVGETVRGTLQDIPIRALVLIGGYGRGEGGVEVLDGIERPHNNLDFLLITERGGGEALSALKSCLDERLKPLEECHGVGIDLGVIPAAKLRRGPCLVMWYDMRFGHKTVLGDSGFVPSLSRHTVERVEAPDLLWLLVNRGSQLLVARVLIDRGHLVEDERKFIVKVAMKAIVAYGDALLFSLGDYHWSYQEKARRMATHTDIPSPMPRLYEEAVAFRFQPRYGDYLQRDLKQWLDDILDPLESAHLRFETWRMRHDLPNWDNYPQAALRHAFFEYGMSPRATGKKILHCLREHAAPSAGGMVAQLSYRTAGSRGRLLAYFPVPMYTLENESLRRDAKYALDARNESLPELSTAFLRTWGRVVDPNFFKTVKRFDLALDPEGAAV